jgi:hypothetical protein
MHRRLLPAVLLVAVAGCGHARLVHRTQYGGTYTLEGDRNKAMEDAHAQITQHCQGPYTIISEGEQVIGSDTAAGSETYVTEDGTVVKQGGASTRQATEWRLQYQCGANQPIPSQPAPYGAPQPQPGDPYDPQHPTSPPPPPPGGQY